MKSVDVLNLLPQLGMKSLHAGVQANLETYLGCESESRFVVFYYDAELGAAFWSDGVATELADDGEFDVLHDSLTPSMAIDGFDLELGGDDVPATHFLLLDSQERALYAGHMARLSRVLEVIGEANASESNDSGGENE